MIGAVHYYWQKLVAFAGLAAGVQRPDMTKAKFDDLMLGHNGMNDGWSVLGYGEANNTVLDQVDDPSKLYPDFFAPQMGALIRLPEQCGD